MAFDVAALGIKVETTGADEAKRKLDALTESSKKTEAAQHGVASGSKTATSALSTLAGGLGTAAGAIAGAAAAALSLQSIMSNTRAALAFGDSIADAAAKIAVSTDTLQEYRYAVKQLGGEYSDADAALRGFSQAFGAAQAGLSKRALKPFEALGLNPKDFKDTEAALDAVIDKISELGSSAEQAAIADRLGLSSMLTALRAGGDEIDRLRDQARNLGIVMDKDLVARAGELNDEFEASQQIIDVQLKSALVDLGPVLVGLIGLVADFARFIAEIADGVRDIENRTTNGLRNQRASVSAQAAQLGLRIMTGREPGDAAQRRLADMNAMIGRLDAELAARGSAASTIGPSGSGKLRNLIDDMDDATKGTSELEKAQREAERAATEFANALERVRGALASEWASASKDATDKMRVLNEAFDKGLISVDELSEANVKLAGNYELVGEVAPEVTGEIKTMNDALRDSGIAVEDLQGNVEFAANQMSDAFYSVANAIDSVLYSLRSGDWGGALSGLLKTVSTIKASISEIGVLGTAGNVAGIVGSAVGGKTGGAISSIGGGLGIAALGSAAGGALANATIGAAFSGAIGGGLANAGLAAAGLLGPIGIIAGVAYALSGLLKGKPTNAGAGYDLTTGQLSGNKRTSETEQAVLAAADAIKSGQSLLANAGLTLTDSVRGLVIGTRDESQIYLSSGKTLTSAVGDAAAATETALLALLDGATYADEQQKKLVDSMRAAGKGFDDITAALETYASAQGLSKTFADAILSFTDPEAYAVGQLETTQAERRAQVQTLFDELYLTADQFAALNAQLDTLEGLELADTLSQFASSLEDLISGAQSDLRSAYEAEAAALNETISTYRQLLNTLRDFDASLVSQMASNASPLTAYRQSQGAFRSIASSTDPSVLAGIPEAGQAYLQAALAIAPDKTTYARVLAEVRSGVAQAEKYAEDQIDTAEAQLEELKRQVELLISIDGGVKTVAQAIMQLGTLLAQQGGGSTNTLPEWFDWQKYAADNPDLAQAYTSGTALTEFGSLEEAIKQHYLLIGQKEIAAGTRYYASGTDSAAPGWAWVGEQGPELMRMRGGEGVISNSNLARMASGSDDETKALLRQMISETAATRRAVEKTESFWRGVTNDGRSINTVAAA